MQKILLGRADVCVCDCVWREGGGERGRNGRRGLCGAHGCFSLCLWCSVELDFKQQEDKLLPLMKRLCPAEDAHFSSLPYPQEAYTSTPKRKSKADSKKHARWKLWFLWKTVRGRPPNNDPMLTTPPAFMHLSDPRYFFTPFFGWRGGQKNGIYPAVWWPSNR